MKKTLSAVFALALLAGVAAGCTDSNQTGKVGENRNREQPPAALPVGAVVLLRPPPTRPDRSWRPDRSCRPATATRLDFH